VSASSTMPHGETTSHSVLAAACMHCSHDVEENLRKYEVFIRKAADRGVQLLVFPEVSVQGHLTARMPDNSDNTFDQLHWYRQVAETVPGPATDRIGRLAKKYNMYVQIGMAECNDPRTLLYNSAVILGPEGLVGVYRKVHNQNEWPIFQSGTEFPVFDTRLGRIGAFICADLHYPECIRAMVLQGAKILTMTTAYPMDGEQAENDPNGRAYEIQGEVAAMVNQVWVVQANQVMRSPKKGSYNYYGHSRIVSPFGVVASCGYEEAVVTASVDILGEIHRHENLRGARVLRRRPDLYRILADPRY